MQQKSKIKKFPYKISADVMFNPGQRLGSGLPVVYARFLRREGSGRIEGVVTSSWLVIVGGT
jgi:hypothetical protein